MGIMMMKEDGDRVGRTGYDNAIIKQMINDESHTR